MTQNLGVTFGLGYALANDIKVELCGELLTVLSSMSSEDNIRIDDDSSEVKLKVRLRKEVSRRTIWQIQAFDVDVNKTIFNNLFTEITDMETQGITTGGGHNDATTYDEENVNIVAVGVITVNKSVAEKVIEHDKKMVTQALEIRSLEKKYRESARAYNDKRREWQQTAYASVRV